MIYTRKTFLGELALSKELFKKGIKYPNMGTTDPEMRKENLRRVIIENNIGFHGMQDLENRGTTIEKFFRDIYREDLKNG